MILRTRKRMSEGLADHARSRPLIRSSEAALPRQAEPLNGPPTYRTLASKRDSAALPQS